MSRRRYPRIRPDQWGCGLYVDPPVMVRREQNKARDMRRTERRFMRAVRRGNVFYKMSTGKVFRR